MATEKNRVCANVKGFKMKDVKGLENEKNRKHEDEDLYVNNVDLSRSHNNTYYKKSEDWTQSITEILDRHNIEIKRNSNVLVNICFRAPSDWLKEQPQELTDQYWDKCYQWAQDKIFTEDSIINAVVHRDEDNPHLEVTGVPICKIERFRKIKVPLKDKNGEIIYQKEESGDLKLDKEGNKIPEWERYATGKSKGKLKYKKEPVQEKNAQGQIVNKAEISLSLNGCFKGGGSIAMSQIQTDFWKSCGDPFGLERGVIRVNDPNKKKSLSDVEYRIKKQKEIIQNQSSKIKDQEQIINKQADQIKSLIVQKQEAETEARVAKEEASFLKNIVHGLNNKVSKFMEKWNLLPEEIQNKIKDFKVEFKSILNELNLAIQGKDYELRETNKRKLENLPPDAYTATDIRKEEQIKRGNYNYQPNMDVYQNNKERKYYDR